MKNIFIKRSYKNSKDIDGDLFLSDSTGKNNEEAVGFLGKFLSEKKLNILLVVIASCLFIVFCRTFYLQVILGDYYGQLAENNRSRENPIVASRGLIYDSQNRPLVKNNPIFDALVLPKDLSYKTDERDKQIGAIAQILNINKSDISAILDKYPKNFKYSVAVKENIDYSEAILLKIKASSVAGLYIKTRTERQYLFPYDFSHVLGYEGKLNDVEFEDKKNSDYLFNDYIGKAGLESTYESVLRGKYGKEVAEVDAAGQEKKIIYRQEVENGKNLVLSIDSDVQKKARDILSEYLRKFNKTRGSLILLNPQNGEILALVSLPDYDSNLFAKGISADDYKKLTDNADQPLFDRAVKGGYPPGSTIKPVIAAGALQEGVITDKTTVMSTGGIRVNNLWFFPDWASGGHGITNVYKAIAWSVNTFFYIVGGGYENFKGLGIDNLDKYFKIFGLGSKTGIDLPGEATGFVPDPTWKKTTKGEDWYIGDTYHVSIGQGDLITTPIQVANYTSVFANKGILYKPHLVKEIVSNSGEKTEIKSEILRENLVDQKNIDIVKKAMRQTVTDGSAKALASIGVAVAGKTGTAQWRTDKQNMAWFTGFAPYDNPEVVITVLVEEGGEGSTVSVPIARDFLNWYFNIYKKP